MVAQNQACPVEAAARKASRASAGDLQSVQRELLAAVSFGRSVPFAKRQAVLIEGMLRTVVDSQVNAGKDVPNIPFGHIPCYVFCASCLVPFTTRQAVLIEGMLRAIVDSQASTPRILLTASAAIRNTAVDLSEGMILAIASCRVRWTWCVPW